MEKFIVETKKEKEIVDITDRINILLEKNSIKEGVCHIFILHTTAALTTTFIDPENDLVLIDVFDMVISKRIPGHPEYQYQHTHIPALLPDYVLASYLGASLSIPFIDGKLLLGAWQRVVTIELNGPKKREIVISFEKGVKE
ncbi:secondary thiamine-phosphate synthase enzyme YjbQ [Patescibacteria group bacterium]|nr:secondary thiamine-phosphate synthase enzyme YjbQ [Patescibacteria group bacterium]